MGFKFKGTFNTVFKFPPVDNALHMHYHHLDSTCSPTTKAKDYVMKLHQEGESFRLECKGQDFRVRRAGPILQSVCETLIKELGHPAVELKCDVDSPTEPGNVSVVSGAIPE